MDLPLDTRLSLGIQTIHRRTEPGIGAWQPQIDELVELAQLVDRCGYDSLWVGDHVASPCPSSIPSCSSPRRRWPAGG
jgi:alkanesulfonate monooxygenase SsuD/methylene tetrahydromethanopterin reductase-like flavin-dependent oxidoreductase (luciferase family)